MVQHTDRERIETPKILVTTSRNPTQQVRSLINDLTRVIPSTTRINRGKSNLTTLAEKAIEHEADRIIIVDRWQGGPGRLEFYTLGEAGLQQHFPAVYVRNVKLQREIGHAKGQAPKNLAIQTDTQISLEAQRLATALTEFLQIPKQSLIQSEIALNISLDHAHRIRITFFQTPQENEIGPRITISHLVWRSPE